MTRPVMRCLCWILILGLCHAIYAADTPGEGLARDEFVPALGSLFTVRMGSPLERSGQGAAALDAVRRQLRELAPQVLPDPLPAEAKSLLDCGLPFPLSLSQDDPQYLTLQSRLALEAVIPAAAYLKEHPPLDAAANDKIIGTIQDVTERARLKMREVLCAAPLKFEPSIVDSAAKVMVSQCKSIVRFPYASEFKRDIDAAAVKGLEDEFDHRLSDAATRLIATSASGGRQPDQRRTCQEVIDWLFKQLRQLSNDASRKELPNSPALEAMRRTSQQLETREGQLRGFPPNPTGGE